MTGAPDLSGRHILVVEDDYYLATDAARALQAVGAMIIGPYANEETARVELIDRRPDAAIVDINLGRGPSFKLAEILRNGGIPFVFITGYNKEAIPQHFNHIERLEKPVQLRRLVSTISKLLASSA
jgi:two-component SAPR family response regulator